MQNEKIVQEQIWQQFIGFIRTPDLLLNSDLLPYPNLEMKSIKIPNSVFLENNIIEINKQLYLGKRVELFFKQWLEFQADAELLAFSLQVIQNKITLGEFDFLWKNNSNYVHTELVYKQYIFDSNIAKEELNCWVGPNKKDFLYLKLKKLKEQQFPLLFETSTEKLLQDKFGVQAANFQQNLCFKAQLFLHFEEQQNQFSGIHTEAIVGSWYYFEEFKSQPFETFEFAFIQKQDWPIIPFDSSWIEWVSFQEIIIKVAPSIQEKRSVKLWMKMPKQMIPLFVIW